jgi:hypothetical protein
MPFPSAALLLHPCGNGVAAGPPFSGEGGGSRREGAQYRFAFFRFTQGRIHKMGGVGLFPAGFTRFELVWTGCNPSE